MTRNHANEAAAALIAHKVPMALRTVYKDGKPHYSEWLKVTVTKKDRFYRIRNKVISRNMAAWAIRAGVAEMAA